MQFCIEPFFTEVFFEEDLFFKQIANLSSPALFLTEEGSGSLFGDTIKKKIEQAGLQVHSLQLSSGEKIKSRASKELVEDFLQENNFGKTSCLIAMGGGALLDLGGFIASTYARGIDLILIPTTMLAMVDACLGGKTAVNTPKAKNLIGSFYPAKYILIKTDFLTTLPRIQKQSALGEVIKYGAIYDRDFFVFLQENQTLWQKQDPLFLKTLIKQSLEIKRQIVEQDPLEKKGLRKILNFGHTIGHGLESLFEYKLPHGICIGIGMVIEAHISQQMGFLSKQDFQRLVSLWKEYQLNEDIPHFSYEQLLGFLVFDKKNQSKAPQFVLLERIGKVACFSGSYCLPVPAEIVQKAIDSFFSFYNRAS